MKRFFKYILPLAIALSATAAVAAQAAGETENEATEGGKMSRFVPFFQSLVPFFPETPKIRLTKPRS